jgi:hypothetical protein
LLLLLQSAAARFAQKLGPDIDEMVEKKQIQQNGENELFQYQIHKFE